ncbi:hypothetical protein ACWNXI_10205 [Caldibacillus thermoamylovorans]
MKIFNPFHKEILIRYCDKEYILTNQDCFFQIPDFIPDNKIFYIYLSEGLEIKTSKEMLRNFDENIQLLKSCTCLDILKDSCQQLKPVNEVRVFYSNDTNIVYFAELAGVIEDCPLCLLIKFNNELFYGDISIVPKSTDLNEYHRTFAYGILIKDFFPEGLYTMNLITLTGRDLTSLSFHYKKAQRKNNPYTNQLLQKNRKQSFKVYKA